jgi:hypothetical protein
MWIGRSHQHYQVMVLKLMMNKSTCDNPYKNKMCTDDNAYIVFSLSSCHPYPRSEHRRVICIFEPSIIGSFLLLAEWVSFIGVDPVIEAFSDTFSITLLSHQ